MQLKKMLACLTAGPLVPVGATAENYHWDNFALKGFGSDAFTVRSATGSNFSGAWCARRRPAALVAARRRPAR